jgi:hypothetical protein
MLSLDFRVGLNLSEACVRSGSRSERDGTGDSASAERIQRRGVLAGGKVGGDHLTQPPCDPLRARLSLLF